MVRKTISISPESWKALTMIGHFGQTFDDLIQMLVEEHNELMRIKGQPQRITHEQAREQAVKPGYKELEKTGLKAAAGTQMRQTKEIEEREREGRPPKHAQIKR
jgi:predicted CopG family antitoxin